MAIKFQYNKTSLQMLDKQLKVREKALPTIKNKESALRLEVKRAKQMALNLEEKLNQQYLEYRHLESLWPEFKDDLVRIEDVRLSIKKIAGVKTPVLDEVVFKIRPYSLFNSPSWFAEGVHTLKEMGNLLIEKEVYMVKMEMLDKARRKTTQKVNLYEKVQIPGFQDAIRKIKRFMEDEENLSKSSQKIVKNRQQQAEVSL
jgi:V/A-type H+/Na+-transporting ATPase subunit D